MVRPRAAPIRVIDAGRVSPLRSQTIYHALAHARTDESPDTIVLCAPDAPYVCIGYHQDLAHEIDLDECSRRGLPVFRREVGGGAVYLDRDQWFVQWIVDEAALPARTDRRFECFARPIVAAYRALGVDAELRPPADVHAGGRKICGTGAGHVGSSCALVGNFLFDFDTDAMAAVLRVGSEAMRAGIRAALQRHMTSFARELGAVPDHEELKSAYLSACARRLGRELVPGDLSPEERAEIERTDRRFSSRAWLARDGGMRRQGVKIREGVWVRQARLETSSGAVLLVATVVDGRIEDVRPALPAHDPRAAALEALCAAARGVCARPADLLSAMSRAPAVRSSAFGLEPRDLHERLVEALLTLLPRPIEPRGEPA